MDGEPDLTQAFKDAMRRLAATVCVVTTADENGHFHGMAATAVTSVSMDPPSILTCVNQSASMHEPVGLARHFCVNLLHRDQAELVRIFSDPKLREKRFVEGFWEHEPSGLPVLHDAQASIVCEREQAIPYGTHTIFIGRVVSVQMRADIHPLVYMNATFRGMGPPLLAGADPQEIDFVF